MATITAAAGGGNWNVGGSWVGGIAPGSGDDALLTGTSGNITIPTATTVACRSLDCTGYTGVFTFASTTAILNVGDASGGACKFVAGMTLTLTGTGTITFLATTASTTYALTSGTKTLPNVTVQVGSSTTIQLADALTLAATASLTFTSGILDTNGKTVTTSATVQLSGSTARTLTLGGSAINSSGTGGWNATTTTNLTVSTNTATLTLSGAAASFASGGINWNGLTLILSGSGIQQITGANTFAALTRTGTAAINDALTLTADQTVTGALTLTGNAAANRLWVQSSVVGTPRTITCNGTVTATRTDFEDITGAGSASWNLAAATGGSGDTGGNSGITFTTPVSATGILAGNFSATATWSTGLVPLPQDTVVLDASAPAGTYTMDMARFPAINAAGFTRTLSLPISVAQRYIFGSLTLASGMTFTATGNLTFAGRGSHTLTMAGKAFTTAAGRSVTFGRLNGTYTLADNADFGSGSGNGLITAGGVTFDAATFNVSAEIFNHGTSTINMGTGIWTAGTASGVPVWAAVAGTTVNASTSTILISTTSTSSRIFAGGGKTYGTLTYTVAGSTGSLSIAGSNTFATINFSDVTNARTLFFTAATTTTITGSFNVQGTAAKLMTIGSSTAANHTLSMVSGAVTCNFLSISRSQAGGGAAWYATSSTDGGNNTGWIFTPVGHGAPPRVIGTPIPAAIRAANW